MRILLHTCCAVCFIGPYEKLTEVGHAVTGYFFNPNIHPLIEFRRRLKAVKTLRDRLKVEIICEEDYGLRDFLHTVDWEQDHRCTDCYRMRLDRTASVARENGFDAFTTTLFTSTHQDHSLITDAGYRAAQEYDVEFLKRDWCDLHEYNKSEARRVNLYRQQYCGCIFSEKERYENTKRHLYKGDGS
jgi:predicted adenine nucleotide alpha hydrolase (AANH) superfamily ATPase